VVIGHSKTPAKSGLESLDIGGIAVRCCPVVAPLRREYDEVTAARHPVVTVKKAKAGLFLRDRARFPGDAMLLGGPQINANAF